MTNKTADIRRFNRHAYLHLRGLRCEVLRQSKATGRYLVRLLENSPTAPTYAAGAEFSVSGAEMDLMISAAEPSVNSPDKLLVDIAAINREYEKLAQAMEQLRVRLSSSTTSAVHRTACIADITIIEGRLSNLSSHIRHASHWSD